MLSKLLSSKATSDMLSTDEYIAYEYYWTIEDFKDWHQNKSGKRLSSPLMYSPLGKKTTKFQLCLTSNGLDKETGRVNLTMHLEYFTAKLFKLVPVEVKISVIDEKDVKRHTQEFSMAAIGVPRQAYVARYFYRTNEDDLKKAERDSPFFLIIDNVATFHFEMRFLSKDEFNEKVELSEAKEKAKKKAAAAARRPILPKIWHAIRNLAKV